MDKVLIFFAVTAIQIWFTFLIISFCLTPLVAHIWNVDIEDYEMDIAVLLYTTASLFGIASRNPTEQ